MQSDIENRISCIVQVLASDRSARRRVRGNSCWVHRDKLAIPNKYPISKYQEEAMKEEKIEDLK
jgi:hypothetical protein